MTDIKTTQYLQEILEQVKKNYHLLREIKGYIGFQEADTTTLNDYGNLTTEDMEHELQEKQGMKELWEQNKPTVHMLRENPEKYSSFDITVQVEKIGKMSTFTYKEGGEGKVQNMLV